MYFFCYSLNLYVYRFQVIVFLVYILIVEIANIAKKELENMINAIDKDIYSFTPSYGKYLIDCWLGDELVDKLLDVSCQYEKLIKLK